MGSRRMGIEEMHAQGRGDMLQMTYLYFTAINKDNDAFNNLSGNTSRTERSRAEPQLAFSTRSTQPSRHNWRGNPLCSTT
jgi:hypothetical protein